jgi:toxin ParE1/3/4
MRFHVTKAAESELDRIFVFWARRAGIESADRLIDSIEERFVMLGEHPLMGRRCDQMGPGIFSFPVGQHLIYYRKRRGVIEILHVFHGARDQSRAFTGENSQ